MERVGLPLIKSPSPNELPSRHNKPPTMYGMVESLSLLVVLRTGIKNVLVFEFNGPR